MIQRRTNEIFINCCVAEVPFEKHFHSNGMALVDNSPRVFVQLAFAFLIENVTLETNFKKNPKRFTWILIANSSNSIHCEYSHRLNAQMSVCVCTYYFVDGVRRGLIR